MKVRIRRASISFAIGSAIYWEAMSALFGLINPLAGLDVAPYWVVALANGVPAALYGIIALVFCHWLAGRVVRQAQQR